MHEDAFKFSSIIQPSLDSFLSCGRVSSTTSTTSTITTVSQKCIIIIIIKLGKLGGCIV